MEAVFKYFSYYRKMVSSILAGILISIGGLVYLNVQGVYGSVLFSFGLITIIYYKLRLFTGKAGFFKLISLSEWFDLFLILLGNLVGCMILAYIIGEHDMASNLLDDRITDGQTNNFLKAIGCGFIMTLIVNAGRLGNYLMVVFGVAAFILCGFYHCIADAYYMFSAESYLRDLYILDYYPLVVLGNLVGCNIPRYLTSNE